MKNIFFIILFAISFSGIGFSQTITFDKTLPASSANQVLQTDDGGYLLNCSDHLSFIKTDQFGYIEWTKEYPEITYPEYPEITYPGRQICKTFDGGYIAVGSILNGSYHDICLIKLDQNLDTIWTRIYGAPDKSEKGYDLIQLPDSSYIISSYEELDLGFYLRKTDANGNLTWKKKVANPAFIQTSYLESINDGTFIFGKYGTVVKMNSNADTLWIKSGIGPNQSYLANDGYILLSTISYLQKLDLDGNIIWQKDIGSVTSFVQSEDDKYILLKGPFFLFTPSTSSIITSDTSGNILSEVSFENSGNYITNTSDGGFAICGEVEISPYPLSLYYAWLLKTDNNINYTAVNLRNPIDGNKLNIFNDYPIIWRSNNVNFVNIDYSTDNQVTWNNVINYYPAGVDTFNWTLPDMPSGNLFIKISDSFNPDVYDRSDPPQTAINYQSSDYIAANEIKMWMRNDGANSHYWDSQYQDRPGFLWPGGENATISAIFEDGLVWGGKVNGEIRVNGNTYRHGLVPGYIMPDGLPSDPLDVKSKIFKLKKDWQYLPPSSERDRYEFDYLNWPIDIGAPWDDNDGDGIYTPGIDNPKIFGDETLFFVANDLDTAASLYTYGSNPIGLEFQTTTFGYNTELLKDVVFKKFKVINKSSTDVTDMYFTYWADDDLGNGGDDLSAFDSTYNMAYVYNVDNDDEFYYGTPPPAVAHMIVQGPIIPATSSDSARFGEGWRKGFKNLGMTSSGLIVKNAYPLPYSPPHSVYEGTLQFYNLMQGLNNFGDYIIDPTTNLPTIWPLTGDPVTGTGWYLVCPNCLSGFDQRYHVPTGPFNMAPNDTQEVVIAFLIKRGTDNINSITELRNYAAQIQHWYDNDFVTDVKETNSTIPLEYSLSQNYPNPFNPSTVISYQLPASGLVSLKVYDILGSEVATLVNEEKPAGRYEVEFKSTVGSLPSGQAGLQLASGVYFYRLQSGSFVETKKMILIK